MNLQIICLFPHLVLTQWTECKNPLLIGNGQCNNEYKFDIKCNYDGGDCCVQEHIGKYGCQDYNNFASCGNFDGGDC